MYTLLLSFYALFLFTSATSEHGYLRGKRKLPPSTANVDTGRNQSAGSKSEDGDDRGSVSRRSMMDLIIETVNRCSEEFDEGVQVQVRFT